MTTVRPLLDHYRIDGLDDVDVEGMNRRIDLLEALAPGTVNTGTEGVHDGHNVRSERTGLHGMVFDKTGMVSTYLHSSIGVKASLSLHMPSDEETRDGLLEGEPGILLMVSRWRAAVAGATRIEFKDGALKRAEDIVRTLILQANPDFPLYQEVEIVFPTWATRADLRMEGKQIVTAVGEQLLSDVLPRVGEIGRSAEQHEITPDRRRFRLEHEPDALAAMRTIGTCGLDTTKPLLRKPAMDARDQRR